MTRYALLCAVLMTASGVAAQTFTEWQDPAVNAVNRAPMHPSWFAYETLQLAAAGDPAQSANYMSLNGMWKFHWVENADQRPTDFFGERFDCSTWDNLPVPAIWELHGYGKPIYVNTGYAWRNVMRPEPPKVPTEQNHVGSYVRTVTLPEGWNARGRSTFIHFGSVTSNLYLWINGRFVGYSEDSKLDAEFDITPYLRVGDNRIAFQVFRWCDGSYMEDQDFWRLSGVARGIYMYNCPEVRLTDLTLTTDLDGAYCDGSLSVCGRLTARGTVRCTLVDPDGTTVAEAQKVTDRTDSISMVMPVSRPAKWSAEQPNLYRLMVSVVNRKGMLTEVIPQQVGFRKVELRGGQVLVNGQPVLFKGADRHEMDPDGGYCVSRERMIEDIKLLKRFNFNAVRTSHYPNDPLWYELCDRYGIYLVAEANAESHGMGYGDRTLARNPLYRSTHLERGSRMVVRDKNHPSVIFWSLGNEGGSGDNYRQVYRWIKAYDTTRPVQYERAIDDPQKSDYTDIWCPMYPTYDEVEAWGRTPKDDRPMIFCEYAHAMGNSLGGFAEYWKLIRTYPNVQGGFIWDFVDQGLRDRRNGRMIYTYGGDYDPRDPSDNNFNCNGLVSPDRCPNPHMYEAGKVQQNIHTQAVDLSAGRVSIFNENFFTDLSDCRMEWTLLSDGHPISSGTIDDLRTAPQQRRTLQLGYTLPNGGEELLLNCRYLLKYAVGLLDADTEVAWDQLSVREPAHAKIVASDARPVSVEMREMADTAVEISAEGFRAVFDRHTGLMTNYTKDDVVYFESGNALRPSFWRAPTDNDFGARLQQTCGAWKNPAMTLKEFTFRNLRDSNMVVVRSVYTLAELSAELTFDYHVYGNGTVAVVQQLSTSAADPQKMPLLMRFGMELTMPSAFDCIRYYGRGPVENYADRAEAAALGCYTSTVDAQYYPYIRPQESGNHIDVRWWRQTDRGGRGFDIRSDQPLSISALPYLTSDLDDGAQKAQRHSGELVPRDLVNLHIDLKQMGLGCVNSWGAWPRPEYMLPYGDYTFRFVLSPVQHALE